MSRTLKIEIDHLPYKELSPNARVHWRRKRVATTSAKLEAAYLTKNQWQDQEPMEYAFIDYEFIVTVERLRDEDNFIAACKPWQDGIVSGGALVADDNKHLKLGSVSISKGSRCMTRITLTEVAETLKGGD